MLYDLQRMPPSESGKREWDWKVPETGAIIGASNWNELVSASRKHYAANGFNYGKALELRIQTVICDRLRAREVRGYCYDDVSLEEFLKPLQESQDREVLSVGQLKGILSVSV